MSAGNKELGFGTFLEFMQSRGIGVQAPGPSAELQADDVQTKVLKSLSLGMGKDVAMLMSDVGPTPLPLLLKTLGLLQQFGLVSRNETSGEVTFQLTPTGVQVAKAALGMVTAK